VRLFASDKRNSTYIYNESYNIRITKQRLVELKL